MSLTGKNPYMTALPFVIKKKKTRTTLRVTYGLTLGSR